MANSETVKKKIRGLIEKYGKETGKLDINDYNNPDTLIRFEGEIFFMHFMMLQCL